MTTLKQFNTATSQWEYVLSGPTGPQGATGPQGPTGSQGIVGPAGTTILPDTGWRDVRASFNTSSGVANATYELLIRRDGNLVTLQYYVWSIATGPSSAINWLPVGYRPRMILTDTGRNVFAADTGRNVEVRDNGTRLILPSGGGGDGNKGEVSWITDDAFPTADFGTQVTAPLASIPFELRGTGFPEGVVTANPGSYYTDANITNGAARWVKMTGTGNTGWKILHGDTGWRSLGTAWGTGITTAASPEGLRVRRRNSEVVFYIRGTSVNGGYGGTLLNIGNGFRSGELPGGIMYYRNYSPHGSFVDVNNVWMTYTATANQPIDFHGGWHTDDSWPTTLPGTAA